MSNRLDKDRETKLQPKRINTAIDKIIKLGITIDRTAATYIQFTFKGYTVTFYPYSGWASGKSIKDGRGIDNLLEQLKK